MGLAQLYREDIDQCTQRLDSEFSQLKLCYSNERDSCSQMKTCITNSDTPGKCSPWTLLDTMSGVSVS